MGKLHVTRKGKHWALNGEVVLPKDFSGIDGFKWVNHIVAWINGGHAGEGGGIHLDRARRYVDEEVCGLGCKRMRAPVELLLWTAPYFDVGPIEVDGQVVQPPEPWRGHSNVANTMDLVNLNCGTGSSFALTKKLEKVIRMFVVIAREFDVVIEVPWLWTIKSEADGEALGRLGISKDPRRRFDKTAVEAKGGSQNGVAVWNEHYLAAHGVGAYLEKLFREGDGEGVHRVDPGGLNLMSDVMNEYTAHVPEVWNKKVLKDVARRWQDRDAPSQPALLCSQSGILDTYDPPLFSHVGVEGFAGPGPHPPRDKAKDRFGHWWVWYEMGEPIRDAWPGELVDANESQLGMTQAQRDAWIPLVPKWAGLGTTDMERWMTMHDDFVSHDIYTTFHTMRGMDGFWPETEQTIVEASIRELTSAGGGHPPEEVERPYGQYVARAYLENLGRKPDPGGWDAYNTALELHYFGDLSQGLSVAEMEEAMRASDEYKRKHPLKKREPGEGGS